MTMQTATERLARLTGDYEMGMLAEDDYMRRRQALLQDGAHEAMLPQVVRETMIHDVTVEQVRPATARDTGYWVLSIPNEQPLYIEAESKQGAYDQAQDKFAAMGYANRIAIEDGKPSAIAVLGEYGDAQPTEHTRPGGRAHGSLPKSARPRIRN